MSKDKLKIAVLGLDESGRLLLEAASKIDCFNIDAVADKDTPLTEKISAQYNCAGFDDYRQLIIQNQFDALLVAAPIYSCDEYVRAAMKNKFNVLKLAPPARNFEEAAELVRLAKKEDVKFAVANPSRFAQSFVDFAKYLKENPLEQPFLINAVFYTGESKHPAWQNDWKLSGGGVLLRNCYHLVDLIVSNFALPQQVYCLMTNTAGEKQQRVYLTEDTAVVTMKFNPALSANLITSRQPGIGPDKEYLQVHGRDKTLTVSHTNLTICDSTGQQIDENEYNHNKHVCMAKLLNDFALSILSPEEHKLTSSGADNLGAMAVIEAAYLSARTGMPEEPARITQMAEEEDEQLKIWPAH